ncbi:unnamed protein product [Closterium sp. Naga37s-1]|nr:unnamed protein product [Closterium sp. Naga37s-1]CAI6012072.1 unnamed protein product [Closterium sp. NIES-65]
MHFLLVVVPFLSPLLWQLDASSRSVSCLATRTKRRHVAASASFRSSNFPQPSRDSQEDQKQPAGPEESPRVGRRGVALGGAAAAASALVSSVAVTLLPADVAEATESNFADMPALRGKDYGKSRMKYADYTETDSGLQFKDLREGTGPTPQPGDLVVVDWAGFTIGYYGRIFEARNKAKGGSFEGNEKDFFRYRVGQGEVIPAFEEAVASMKLGGVRRIVVPPEIGYPDNNFNKQGPKPTTFSGQRALDFVLKNQGLIDKTLLFDIELLKIVPS